MCYEFFPLYRRTLSDDFIQKLKLTSYNACEINIMDGHQVLLKNHRTPGGSVARYGATAAIKEGRIASFNDPVSVVVRSSLRGPDILGSQMTPGDVLKPDILAPGNQIWSAWSPDSSQEPILFGRTTPHIEQSHPSWTLSMMA